MSARQIVESALRGVPRATFVPVAWLVFMGMAASVIVRTYGDALFLDVAGIERLPLFMVLSAALLAVVSGAYSFALLRFAPAGLDRVILLLMAAATAAPVLVPAHTPAAAFACAAALTVISSIANIVAWNWTLAAIDTRIAKRAMPLIGAAATLGAVIFGGLIVPFVRVFGTSALPWAGSLLYIGMSRLPAVIDARGTVVEQPGASLAPSPKAARSRSGTRALVAALVIYALFESLAAAIAEFQLKAAVQSGGGRERMAMLLGMFQSGAGAGVLLLQLSSVGRVLARHGIQVGLFLAPIAMLASTAGVLAMPLRAGIAALPKLSDSLLKFSFSRSALEIAMVPLGDIARRRAKVLVRGLPGPLGSMIAGGVLFLLGAGGSKTHTATPWLTGALLAVPVLVLWLLSARFVLRAYLSCLRGGLRIHRVGSLAQPVGAELLERGAQDALLELVLADPKDAAFAGEILIAGLSQREADRLCSHKDARVRRIAWAALAHVSGAQRPLDLRAARLEEDANVRIPLLDAFARRQDDRLAPDARDWIAYGTPEVIQEARRYLGSVGRLDRAELERMAVDLLATDGRRAGALLRAAVQRGVLSDHDAIELLRRAGGLGHFEKAAHRPGAHALRALVELATPEALREVLVRAHGFGSASVTRAFVDAPAQVGELLQGELRTAPREVRERVARALGVAPDLASRLGITLLQDDDPMVRTAAARSLIRLRHTVAGARPPADVVTRAVRTEIALGSAYRLALARLEGRTDAASTFARTEIDIRLRRVAERLFQLLAAGGDAHMMQAAMRRYHSGEEGVRRAVLTLLEDLPSTPLRARVVAYLEGGVEGDAGSDEALEGDAFLAKCLRDDEDMRLLRPRIETLRATTMFAGLDGDILTDVAWSAEEIEVAPGQIVVRQAEPGDALFAVMEGEIRFEKNGAPLGTATAGHAFGELSIIDGSPRGATAIATRPGRLLRVRRTAVHSAMARHPDVWLGLARSLAAWIRKA